jgi:hypothetical protein
MASSCAATLYTLAGTGDGLAVGSRIRSQDALPGVWLSTWRPSSSRKTTGPMSLLATTAGVVRVIA